MYVPKKKRLVKGDKDNIFGFYYYKKKRREWEYYKCVGCIKWKESSVYWNIYNLNASAQQGKLKLKLGNTVIDQNWLVRTNLENCGKLNTMILITLEILPFNAHTIIINYQQMNLDLVNLSAKIGIITLYLTWVSMQLLSFYSYSYATLFIAYLAKYVQFLKNR